MREIDAADFRRVAGGGIWCGPQGSWLSGMISDSPFGFYFGEVCRQHDRDYLDAVYDRAVADQRFLVGMLDVANGDPLGELAAYGYYGAVRASGWMFYGSDAPEADPGQTVSQIVEIIGTQAIEEGRVASLVDWLDLAAALDGFHGRISAWVDQYFSPDSGGMFTDPQSAPAPVALA